MKLRLTVFKYLLFLSILLSPLLRAADIDRLEQEVFAVERAFAQSMADRNFAAFSEFLDPDTVFFAQDKPLRGKQTVAEAWKGYFDAPAAPFAWQPEIVAVTGDGTTALSTGPVTAPDGRIFAYYSSTWRKNAAGEWKIILDKGHKYCPPETGE